MNDFDLLRLKGELAVANQELISMKGQAVRHPFHAEVASETRNGTGVPKFIVPNEEPGDPLFRRVALLYPKTGSTVLMALLYLSLYYHKCDALCSFSPGKFFSHTEMHIKVSPSMDTLSWAGADAVDMTGESEMDQFAWARMPLFTHGVMGGAKAMWLRGPLSLFMWNMQMDDLFKRGVHYKVVTLFRPQGASAASARRAFASSPGYSANWEMHANALEDAADQNPNIDVFVAHYDRLVEIDSCVQELGDILAFFGSPTLLEARLKACRECHPRSMSPAMIAHFTRGNCSPRVCGTGRRRLQTELHRSSRVEGEEEKLLRTKRM